MLTVTAIKNDKPKEKAYRQLDRDGLYLLVEPTGQKKKAVSLYVGSGWKENQALAVAWFIPSRIT